MKLSKVVNEYVTYKRSLGMCFNTETWILASFCRYIGGEVSMDSISADSVKKYLDGGMTPSSYWNRKYRTLVGLYRFGLARNYTKVSPLPSHCPKLLPPLIPYIYSQGELKHLLNATPAACGERASLDALVLRNLILLLYGACLRVSEGLHLKIKDFNSSQAMLCIRNSKFYKSRFVPLGHDLNIVMEQYVTQYRAVDINEPDAPLFCFRDGRELSKSAVGNAFRRLRVHARVKRFDGARYQPRLHDLRHYVASRIM